MVEFLSEFYFLSKTWKLVKLSERNKIRDGKEWEEDTFRDTKHERKIPEEDIEKQLEKERKEEKEIWERNRPVKVLRANEASSAYSAYRRQVWCWSLLFLIHHDSATALSIFISLSSLFSPPLFLSLFFALLHPLSSSFSHYTYLSFFSISLFISLSLPKETVLSHRSVIANIFGSSTL